MQQLETLATNKKFLHTIADNGYELPGDIDAFALATALLANFASTDSELRDELSYMVLTSAIIEKQKLAPAQLSDLLAIALDDDHLFYRIGESETDGIFLRSFSNLLIAAILYIDSKNPHLPAEMILRTQKALFRYAQQERDWRGYVEEKGWAHAMAHLSDALDECAQHGATTTAARQDILALLRKLAQITDPLHQEEDIRLAKVAYHIIIGKQVSDEFISSWLETCYVPRGGDVPSWNSATNSKNFLRSLYFCLLWDNMALKFVDQISDLLQQQDAIYLESGSDNS